MTKFPNISSFSVKMSLFAHVPGTALVVSIRALSIWFCVHRFCVQRERACDRHFSQALRAGAPIASDARWCASTATHTRSDIDRQEGPSREAIRGWRQLKECPSKDFGDKQGQTGRRERIPCKVSVNNESESSLIWVCSRRGGVERQRGEGRGARIEQGARGLGRHGVGVFAATRDGAAGGGRRPAGRGSQPDAQS